MRKSWDRFASENTMDEATTRRRNNWFSLPVRVVPWPEGCPFTPEQVPQVGEKLSSGRTILGVPYRGVGELWYISTNNGAMFLENVVTPQPHPTVDIFGKTYNEDAVRERLASLEEV